MDLMYIAHPSLAQDLRIIFATVKILFLRESTEGVAEGQTTASVVKSDTRENKDSNAQTQHVVDETEQNNNI